MSDEKCPKPLKGYEIPLCDSIHCKYEDKDGVCCCDRWDEVCGPTVRKITAERDALTVIVRAVGTPGRDDWLDDDVFGRVNSAMYALIPTEVENGELTGDVLACTVCGAPVGVNTRDGLSGTIHHNGCPIGKAERWVKGHPE